MRNLVKWNKTASRLKPDHLLGGNVKPRITQRVY